MNLSSNKRLCKFQKSFAIFLGRYGADFLRVQKALEGALHLLAHVPHLTKYHLIGVQQLYPFGICSHVKDTTHCAPFKWWFVT